MKTKENTKIEKLTIKINAILNERLDSFNQLKNVNQLWRYVEAPKGRIAIQPTYSDTLYNPQALFHAIEECGCSYFIEVRPNFNGVPAPAVYIYEK